jgi:NOL1/NOP2/fmu family ribosome biogenesis protein
MYKILNSKEKKKIIANLEKTYNIKNLDLDFIFLERKKEKIFIINKNFRNLNLENLKINSVGLYFCKKTSNNYRLTIEGSQLIGNKAKNIINLNREEIKQWVNGQKIQKNIPNGDYLIKHNNDFFGATKVKNNILINFVAKERRIVLRDN